MKSAHTMPTYSSASVLSFVDCFSRLLISRAQSSGIRFSLSKMRSVLVRLTTHAPLPWLKAWSWRPFAPEASSLRMLPSIHFHFSSGVM